LGAQTGDATVYNYDGQNMARTYVIPGSDASSSGVRDYRFYTHSNTTDGLLGFALADPSQTTSTSPSANLK